MLTPLFEALAADADEFVGGALDPGRHHHPVVVPDGAEALPVAGVAPDRPVLDQLADQQPVLKLSVHSRPLFDGFFVEIGHFVPSSSALDDVDLPYASAQFQMLNRFLYVNLCPSHRHSCLDSNPQAGYTTILFINGN